MDESTDAPNEERGLYPKYRAIKITNEDQQRDGSLMVFNRGILSGSLEVTEPFFLLKFDDPCATKALEAYANACETKYPQLAHDIREKVYEVGLTSLRERLSNG